MATRASRSPAVDRATEAHKTRNSRTANTSRNVARGGTAPFTVALLFGSVGPRSSVTTSSSSPDDGVYRNKWCRIGHPAARCITDAVTMVRSVKIISSERPVVHPSGQEEFARGVDAASPVSTERSLTMPDESGSLVLLAGSDRTSLPDATETAPLDAAERAEITVVLRRRAELPAEIVEGPTVLSHAELGAGYGADPADVDLVSQELTSRGLEVTEVHPTTRRVKVAGSLGDLSRAFGTTLRQVSSPDPSGRGRVTHRYREGPLYVPAALADVVTAVLGLDTRPQAKPPFRGGGGAGPGSGGGGPAPEAAAPGTTYPPNQVAQLYNFPANTTGAGQTIAVIELGGGFTTSDLA